MPQWLIRFFESKDFKFHLLLALGLGLLFRLASAYIAYGPLAMDDFVDGVYPAFQLSKGEWPQLNIGRSYLLVWILTAFVKKAQLLGLASEGVNQVRAMYMGLGLLSLGTIVGGYFYVRESSDRCFQALTLYLLSIYFILPFLGTRSFGETASMPWIVMGVGLLQYASTKKKDAVFFAAFLCLGIGSFFRFQNGIIFLTCALLLCVQKRWRPLGIAFLAGFVAIALQGTIDTLSYGKPFHSFFEHVKINQHGGAEFGSQPWYVHIAMLLGCTLAPFSLVFVDKIVPVAKKHLFAVCPLVAFVLVHTFIAHKEERYMSPVLPLLLILLAAVWSEKRKSIWVRRLYFPAFAMINFSLLFLVTVSNTQASEIAPIVDVQATADSGIFIDTNTELGQNFFSTHIYLNKNFSFRKVDLNKIDRAYLEKIPAAVAVILAAPEVGEPNLLSHLANLKSQSVRCSEVHSGSSPTDRLIYKLNPKRNTRRRPTLYVVCRLG